MRYYNLSLFNVGDPNPVRTWTSHPGGQFDPGALNLEFDIPITPMDTPVGGQTITIEGISLTDLQQAQAFTGMQFVLQGGMKTGLPLANPLQAGVIAQGFVFQSFGNWEGTEMTLDFVIYPSTYNHNDPGNIVIDWKANASLSDALMQTMGIAFPGIQVSVNISQDLMLGHDEVGYYASLDQLAMTLGDITEQQGHRVFIVMQNGSINIFDDTYVPPPIQINFTDLIGQPTWINPNTMQLKVVMRGDIQIGQQIQLPPGMQSNPGIVRTTAQSLPSSMKYQTSFTGVFQVTEMRHLGNFRASDGASWASIINCVVVS